MPDTADVLTMVWSANPNPNPNQDDHALPNIDLEYCGIDGWRCAEPPQATPQSQGGMYDVD